MRYTTLLAVFLSVGLTATTKTTAGPIIFDNETNFLNNANVTGTTTFATPFSPANPIVIDDITYTAEFGGSVFFFSLSIGVNNSEGMGSTNIELNTLTFGAGMEVEAIGFYIVPSVVPDEDFEQLAYDVTLTDRIGNTFTEILDFTQFPSNPAPEAIFRGYTDTAGITQVTVDLNSSLSDFSSNFAFDNVSRSNITAVPEPSVFALMAVFVTAGTFCALRRQRHGRYHSSGCAR